MFTFEVKNSEGLIVEPVKKVGTAAQHYTWCVSQAITLLNEKNPRDAIHTFVSDMKERPDTHFDIKFKWPWLYDNQVQLVLRCICDRAQYVGSGISCQINSIVNVESEENQSSLRCTLI